MPEVKICKYCKKSFEETDEEKLTALSKGGGLDRDYCRDCLKKWRKGEIKLSGK